MMLKRITVALFGMLVVLGLTVSPTNGTTAETGNVTLFEQTLFDVGGRFVVVPEVDIPTDCSPIPSELVAVRSARNETTGPGTSISLFTNSECTSLAATIAPEMENGNINSPDGATFWRVTS